MIKPVLVLVSILLTYALTLNAQDTIPVYELDETIVVTASRIPISQQHLSRSMIILDQTFIKSAPAGSIQELFDFAGGIDMKQQGASGVMGHIGIRGANYEQTVILVDGVKMNDPQTGHHNFHLPLDLNHIEKIEILKGPASRLYGPNALAGAVNIITKKMKNNSFNLKGSYGADKTFTGFSSLSLNLDNINQRLSFSTHGSDGYRFNTDYKIYTGSYSMEMDCNNYSVNVLGGYTQKSFGANQFYGSDSELQWEETKTAFLNTGLHIHGQNTTFNAKVSWRKNKDHYIWNKQHPEWYENFHTSNLYTAETQLTLATSLGTLVLGGEISKDDIKSKNLGIHDRQSLGLYAEQHYILSEDLAVIPGASLFYYSDWGWHLWPGIDIEYQINEYHQLFASYGQAFRIPTYTELYYSDPDNRGNPFLKPEDAWTVETGYRYTHHKFSSQVAIFLRRSDNQIDWIKTSLDSPWVAHNFAEIQFKGMEINLSWQPAGEMSGFCINQLDMSYTYLGSTKENSQFSSKYVADHLRNQLKFRLYLNLGLPGLAQFIGLRYEDRVNFSDHVLLDTRINWQYGQVTLYADMTNLLDVSYHEYLLIPMPGRKFTVGMAYSWLEK